MKVLKKERESGIELLKIIAILLIVISHVSQTFGTQHEAYSSWNCFRDGNIVATNIQYIILMLFQGHFGGIGNNIFFLCSAWFLCESAKKRNGQKMLQMVLDVWVISMICLASFFAWGGVKLSVGEVIKSLFPTTFLSNWYITCYLLFYAIFPYLNWVIAKMSQKELLTADLIAFFFYFGIGFVYHTAFFASNIVSFIVMYFFMAYFKLYVDPVCAKKLGKYPQKHEDSQNNLQSSRKKRKSSDGSAGLWAYLLLAIGITGYVGIVLATNFAGLKIELLRDKVLYWANRGNPFLLSIAFALFLIFRQKKFRSIFINRVAGMSLLIYVIHENLLLRNHFRPRVFYWIYKNFGYQYLVLWVLGFAAALFLAAAAISFLYQHTIQKLTAKLSQKLLEKLLPVYDAWMDRLMGSAHS